MLQIIDKQTGKAFSPERDLVYNFAAWMKSALSAFDNHPNAERVSTLAKHLGQLTRDILERELTTEELTSRFDNLYLDHDTQLSLVATSLLKQLFGMVNAWAPYVRPRRLGDAPLPRKEVETAYLAYSKLPCSTSRFIAAFEELPSYQKLELFEKLKQIVEELPKGSTYDSTSDDGKVC